MSNLKKKRLEIGLKQNAVARRLKVSIKTYQRYEKEETKPSNERLLEIAKIFNCNVAEISQKE